LLPLPANPALHTWWSRSLTLRAWFNALKQLTAEEIATTAATTVSGETILPGFESNSLASLSSFADGSGASLAHVTADFVQDSWEIFYANQRARWIALKAFNKWRWNIWRKRPHCGVDMIMNDPVEPRDALYLMDTRNRAVYCFHRRDIFTSLMSRLSAADEMLPTPRQPTNPWTNQELTLGQTIAVCQAILQHSVARGRCPPTLFAAFCAAGYNLRRFESENTSFLAQHAITAYFKDLHEHNRETVTDTMLELLRDSAVRYSAVAVRRWLRATPVTPLHREWLAMVRDYTLHINLHIQPRRHWYHDIAIYTDVRELFRRTPLEDPAGPRLRLLRNQPSPLLSPVSVAINQLMTAVGAPIPLQSIVTDASAASLLLTISTRDQPTTDISGNTVTNMVTNTVAEQVDASGNATNTPPIFRITTTSSLEEDAVNALMLLLQSTMNQ
jgi:hypothetical protein